MPNTIPTPEPTAPADPQGLPEDAPSYAAGDPRAAALAAALAADRTTPPAPPQEGAPEAPNVGRAPPPPIAPSPQETDATAAEATPEPPSRALRAAIRAREEAARIRAEAERERVAAAAEMARLQAERERYAPQLAALEALRQGRLDALPQLGVKYEDVIKGHLQENTPEGRLELLQRQLAEQTRALEEMRGAQARAAQEATRQASERQFLSMVTPEATPYLATVYEGAQEDLLEEAYRLQTRYQQRTGRVPSRAELAEALEELTRQRYSRAPRTAAVAAPPPPAPEEIPEAPAPAAPGTPSRVRPGVRRTLSSADSARTSAPPVDLSSLSHEERKARALREALKLDRQARR